MELKVYSEIGKLKKVLVHRPGKEVERIYPELFKRLLFDNIMYLKVAQEEHDYFTDKLREEGVEVFYIERLVAEVLDSNHKLREEFINDFLRYADVKNKAIYDEAKSYFLAIKNNLEMVQATIAGIKKTEINPKFSNSLIDQIAQKDEYPFYIDPIPNIIFQRDPISTIFDSMNLHKMYSATRRREKLYYEFGFMLHPEFKNIHYNMKPIDDGHIEGGDILVINKETIFVGISQRTNSEAIEIFAKKLFKRYDHLQRIIGIEIPQSHATMHLDTMMTQIDHDKFVVYSHDDKKVYYAFELTRGDGSDLKVTKIKASILDVLKKYVNSNVQIIIVGGGEVVRAKREQWNDGANSLCLKPGTVIVYDRNVYTNNLMKATGIKIIEIKSSELSSGRGGPRCMSMPLEREEI